MSKDRKTHCFTGLDEGKPHTFTTLNFVKSFNPKIVERSTFCTGCGYNPSRDPDNPTPEPFKLLIDETEDAADKKIKQAITLFNKADNHTKSAFLRATGFSGVLIYETLYAHLEFRELTDSIDSDISYFEENAELAK